MVTVMPCWRPVAARVTPLLAALTLSGCSPPPIDLTIVQVSGRLVVKMSQDWGLIFPDRQTPCIRQAKMFPGRDYEAPVWQIEAEGGVQCLDLDSFTVGAAPKGFKEVVPLSPKAKGPHTLEVFGIGGGEATLTL